MACNRWARFAENVFQRNPNREVQAVSEKTVEVTVETMDGETVLVKANVENKVEHLMREAARELGIGVDIRVYDLTFEGQRLDPESKIENTSIRNGSRVRLERRPRVG